MASNTKQDQPLPYPIVVRDWMPKGMVVLLQNEVPKAILKTAPARSGTGPGKCGK